MISSALRKSKVPDLSALGDRLLDPFSRADCVPPATLLPSAYSFPDVRLVTIEAFDVETSNSVDSSWSGAERVEEG